MSCRHVPSVFWAAIAGALALTCGAFPGGPRLSALANEDPPESDSTAFRLPESSPLHGLDQPDRHRARPGQDGRLEGLSGRFLTPDPAWKHSPSGSGVFYPCLLPAFDFEPQPVIERLMRVRREEWERKQRSQAARERRRLAAFDSHYAEPNAKQAAFRAELRARVEMLDRLQEAYQDPGPIYDGLVFEDTTGWKVVADRDGDGLFADESPLPDIESVRPAMRFNRPDPRETAPADADPTASGTGSEEETESWTSRVDRLGSLYADADSEAFARLHASLVLERPDHLPIHVHALKQLDQTANRKRHLGAVIRAADKVVSLIDTRSLRAYFGSAGIGSDAEPGGERMEEMTRIRRVLTDALYRKGRAIAYAETLAENRSTVGADVRIPEIGPGDFDRNFAELQSWVDTTRPEFRLLHIRNERRRKRYGVALKHLQEHMKQAAPSRMLFDKRIKILGKLGWTHWVDHEREWNLIRFSTPLKPVPTDVSGQDPKPEL